MKKLFYIVLLLSSVFGFAQNKGMTYQAVIYAPGGQNVPGVNVANVPMANRTICLQFSFLDASSGIEYQEEVKTKTDEFGMVNITIGTGTQTGGYASSFAAIVWSAASEKSLKIALDATGLCSQFDELSVEKLQAVPFANAANIAGNVSGVVAIANGGTGAATAPEARTNLGIGNVENTADLNKPMSTATKIYVDTQIVNSTIPDATTTAKGKIQLAGDLAGTAAAPTVPGLMLKENVDNKSTNIIDDRDSTTKYPSVKVIKDYVDALNAAAGVADGSITSAKIANATIVNADVAPTAAIDFTKLNILKADVLGLGIVKADFGLGNVDNTSDADKQVSTATQAALDLKANMVDLATEVTRATAAETILTTNLATEATTARAAELANSNAITAEATTSRAAEATLTTNLTANATAIAAETSRATAAETTLTTNLATEATTARAAELANSNAITAEATTARAAEANLTTNVTANATAIAAETTRATAAETTLTTNLATEATTARAAELANSNAITAEATTARAAETTLTTNLAAANTAIALKEDTANKSITTTLGTSDVLFPTQNAVKTYVDTAIAGATIVDADATTKGKLQLAGDLTGTADLPEIAASAVTSSKILDGTIATADLANTSVTDAKINTVSGSKVTGDITGNAANVNGVVDIENGGTGSDTKNFVDLTTAQTVAGTKSFSNDTYINELRIGKGAGSANYYQNTALGYVALSSNTTGEGNTAIGYDGQKSGTTGSLNTSIGFAALIDNTTGSGNTALGYQTLQKNSGDNNIAIGMNAMYLAQNSNNNIVLGSSSLEMHADGARDNIILGVNSLNAAVAPIENIVIGNVSGTVFTNETNNTLIGNQTDITAGVTNGTAIGNGAVVNASNRIQLGNSAITNVKTAGTITAGGMTYPNTTGTTNQVLTTDGTGSSTWQTFIAFNKEVSKVNFGANTGYGNQAEFTTAVGPYAGQQDQGINATALGRNAGNTTQGASAVAVGALAGAASQGVETVAVGLRAGETAQGAKSVAIGAFAGQTNQHANSIILNATGAALNSDNANALYIAPIRSASNTNVLLYNPTTKEVTTAANIPGNAANVTGTVAIANGGTNASTAAAALTNLGAEATGNKSTTTTLGTSDVLFPTQNAVKVYVDSSVSSGAPDATDSLKGKIQLAGDLTGTAALPAVAVGAITTSKLADNAVTNIKLATGIDATKLADGSVTNTELQYIGTLASDAQTQIDALSTAGTTNTTAITAINTLDDGKIYLGNASNVATEVTPTGDVTMTNAGVTAIGTSKVVTAMLATDAVTTSKITNANVTTAKLADDAVETAKIKNANVTDAKLDKANIPLSGFAAAAADVDLGSNKLTNVTNPTAAQDAATKNYVDTATSGITTLDDGKIYLGNASNVATEVTPTGDVTITNAGVTAIGTSKVVTAMLATDAVTTSKITNANVTTAKLADDAVETAKIKNANVTDAKLDKANIPLSGFAAAAADVDLGSNKLTNVTNPTAAQDAATKNYVDTATSGITTLDDGKIYLGNASNVATEVTPTGDVTITNAGVTAIGTSKVVTAMLATDAVTTSKITNANVTTAKLADDAVETAKIKNANVTYAKIQNVSATNKVLGRVSSGAGVIEEIATTGSGSVVRDTSPTLVTPDLGTPSAAVLTNATDLPLTSGVTGTLPIANGGTGATTAAAALTNLVGNQSPNTVFAGLAAGVTTVVSSDGSALTGWSNTGNLPSVDNNIVSSSFKFGPSNNWDMERDLGESLMGKSYQFDIYFTTGSNNAFLFGHDSSGANGRGIFLSQAGTSNGFISGTNSFLYTNRDGSDTNTFSPNTWYTIKVKLATGTNASSYSINGVQKSTFTWTDSGNKWFGFVSDGGISYIDNISVTSVTTGAPTFRTLVAADIPTLNQNTTGNAATATTATNITGGASGSIPYQTAAATTAMLAKGTDGQVLTLASGVPSWASPTGITTMAAIGSTPNANGATISGTTINLEPADTTNGGVVTTTAQTFAGAKTFSNTTTFNSDIVLNGITIGNGNGSVGTNLAVGKTALNTNTLSPDNTAIGYQALKAYNNQSATTGFGGNTAVGSGALSRTTNGNQNTAVGSSALQANTTGGGNVAMGIQALNNNTTGLYNVGIGASALNATTSGYENAALGKNALGANITGYQLTAIGANTDVSSSALTNATALGYGAIVNASNKIQLGNTSVTAVNTSGKLTTGAVTYPNTDGAANQVLLTNGSGVASFGAIPTLNQNTTGTAANVTGTVAIANGGTGSTTKNFVDLTTDQTIDGVKTFSGTSTVVNQNLTVNAAGTSGQGIILSDDGDIVDNNDGAATFRFGAGIKINSGNKSLGTATKISLTNTGHITAAGTLSGSQLTSTIATGTAPLVVTSTTPVANLSIGGNAATATTATHVTGGDAGSLPYQTAAATTAMLAKGTDGKVLTLASGLPSWSNSGGAIASMSATGNASSTASYIIFTGSSASQTITVPSAATVGAGKEITIKNVASVSVSIASASGNLIQDNSTLTATTAALGIEPSNNWMKLVSDGTNWYIFRALF